MDEKRITVQDVVRASISILGEIQVPVKYSQTIGKPISDVIGALSECVAAMEGGGESGDDHAE